MQYFFILGRNPELSCAELHAILPAGWRPVVIFQNVLIIECEPLDASHIMKLLGGTIKMGEILSHSTHPISHTTIVESLGKTVKDKKLFLGLSAYALDKKIKLPNIRELRKIGIETKRALEEQKYRVRLVTSKEVALSSVIVKKERLLRQGAEIALFYATKKNQSIQPLTPETLPLTPQLIGRTLAVQEFEEASARDFGRPERAMSVGMLPIQLTKIMLNLARAPKTATILDPFCGLGTVLMEATQMGYKNLIGTDLDQKMIDATDQNLNWLAKHNKPFYDSGETANVKLLTAPAEELSKHLGPHSVDAIVTEPYLGPTRDRAELKILISELSTLYIAAFREFSKILKPGGRVVFIFPAFKNGSTPAKTSDRVLPEIKKLGFTPIQLLPSDLPNPYHLTPSPSITYSRPDQKVLREIFVLTFKP